MAQAVADRSKLRRAQKRGRGVKPLPISNDVVDDRRRGRAAERGGSISTAEILRHLEVLGASIPRTMEVVTLHLVLGIPLDRVAEMLSISQRTAYRELLNGRDRLAQRLRLKEDAR
jgi:DNA-directed RNA polymerase specialized sigma24 family protein